jgi:hypothetical protein
MNCHVHNDAHQMVPNDLTITLFLVGTGMALLIAGIQQAGWRHKSLLFGLFIGGSIFLFNRPFLALGRKFFPSRYRSHFRHRNKQHRVVRSFNVWLNSLLLKRGKDLGEKPDADLWRRVPTFRLREAAWLLADTNPDNLDVDPYGRARVWFRLLDKAWNSGELERVQDENPDIRITTRGSLKKFCHKFGKIPDFLAGP